MFFKKGDRVVCIDDTPPKNENWKKIFQQWIKEGQVYTVRGTSMDLEGNQGILLEGVTNTPIFSAILGGKFEPRFNSKRFKKLDELQEEVKKEERLELAC